MNTGILIIHLRRCEQFATARFFRNQFSDPIINISYIL